MAETITCLRCGQQALPPGRLLMATEAAAEIRAKICSACWEEWQKGEVVVINELRLNFMDPKSQEILNQHMREFLYLDGKPAGGSTPSPLDNVTPPGELPKGDPSQGDPGPNT